MCYEVDDLAFNFQNVGLTSVRVCPGVRFKRCTKFPFSCKGFAKAIFHFFSKTFK